MGGVNENGGSANRPDKITTGINAYYWRFLMLLGMRSLWNAKGVCNVCLSFVSILNHRHGSTSHRFGTETGHALDPECFPCTVERGRA